VPTVGLPFFFLFFFLFSKLTKRPSADSPAGAETRWTWTPRRTTTAPSPAFRRRGGRATSPPSSGCVPGLTTTTLPPTMCKTRWMPNLLLWATGSCARRLNGGRGP